MPSRSATETCHFEDVLHYQARLRGEVIVLKKSIRLLGLDSDPCAPHLTLHTGTRLWFTNILSSTWSLGSKPAQIRPFVQQRGSFTNSFWQKEGGSLRGLGRGAKGVQLLQLRFHLLIDLASSAGLQIFKSLVFLRFLCDIEKCDTPVSC